MIKPHCLRWDRKNLEGTEGSMTFTRGPFRVKDLVLCCCFFKREREEEENEILIGKKKKTHTQ